MSGTSAGGKLAAETNKKRHGKDFYVRIGKSGGEKGHTGGFFADRELARTAGQKGGRKSRRGPLSTYKDPARQSMEAMEVGDSIMVIAGEGYSNAVRAQRIMRRSSKTKRFVIHPDAMQATMYRVARTR